MVAGVIVWAADVGPAGPVDVTMAGDPVADEGGPGWADADGDAPLTAGPADEFAGTPSEALRPAGCSGPGPLLAGSDGPIEAVATPAPCDPAASVAADDGAVADASDKPGSAGTAEAIPDDPDEAFGMGTDGERPPSDPPDCTFTQTGTSPPTVATGATGPPDEGPCDEVIDPTGPLACVKIGPAAAVVVPRVSDRRTKAGRLRSIMQTIT